MPQPHASETGAAQSLRRPFSQARTLPGKLYSDEAIFRQEQARIFGSMWLCVGREEDIAEPGDYFTCTIGHERLLMVKDKRGQARAFFNVCRHRGARLVQQDSGCGLHRITCPYHAWTYANDGRLVSAPDMADEFDREGFPLVAAQCESHAGFLFISLDKDAEPLGDYLSDLPDLSRYRMGELRRGARVDYEVAANWKLICENYNECYHCALVHPQLHRISDARSGGTMQHGRCFAGGPMLLNEGFNSMTLSGHSDRPVIPGLSAADHKTINYYTVFPNFLLSLHPDYVLTHTIWPLGPQRTRVVCEWFFTREAMQQADFDPADAVEFWDITNRQDWSLCERTQLGTLSRGYRPGPYHKGESVVHAFDDWYLERMGL